MPARFAERLRAAHSALDRLAGEIEGARLDALVVIGDDQKELFLDDCIPALAVYCGQTIAHQMRPPKRAILVAWMTSALVVRLWAGRRFLRDGGRIVGAISASAGSGNRTSPGASAAT